MKVLYISTPPFFDLDLSFVRHMASYCDITYLLDMPPYFLKSSAVQIQNQIPKNAILNSEEYIEFSKFEKFIKKESFFIINRTSKRNYSLLNFKIEKEIISFIEKLNPDIIHCSSFLTINSLYLLLKYRKKIILTVHDPFPHSGELSPRIKRIRNMNFSIIKNIIILNKSQKEKFIFENTKYSFKNIFISSLSIYEYLSEYNSFIIGNNHKFNILFFGRVSKYKGIDHLLESFLILEKSLPDIELIVAGSGKYWFDTSSYRNNPKITILNRFISNEELANLIHNSDLIVCPYTDATQSGVIMTAFALNKPVLATKVGGLEESIIAGVTGFLVPPSNITALTDKLKYIIDNQYLLKEIHKNIDNIYNNGDKSWNSISKKMVEYYSIVLSNK